MVYTLVEKVFLIKHFYKSNDRYSKCVQDAFRERFNKEPMNRNGLKQLISKFEETGSVQDASMWTPKSDYPKKDCESEKVHRKKSQKISETFAPASEYTKSYLLNPSDVF